MSKDISRRSSLAVSLTESLSLLKSQEGAGEPARLSSRCFWTGSSRTWSSGMLANCSPRCLGPGDIGGANPSSEGPLVTTVTLKRRAVADAESVKER